MTVTMMMTPTLTTTTIMTTTAINDGGADGDTTGTASRAAAAAPRAKTPNTLPEHQQPEHQQQRREREHQQQRREREHQQQRQSSSGGAASENAKQLAASVSFHGPARRRSEQKRAKTPHKTGLRKRGGAGGPARPRALVDLGAPRQPPQGAPAVAIMMLIII